MFVTLLDHFIKYCDGWGKRQCVCNVSHAPIRCVGSLNVNLSGRTFEQHVFVFATFASNAHFVFLPRIKPFIPISIMSLSDLSSSSSINPGINNRVAGTAVDPHHADDNPDAPGNFINNYDLDCEGGDDYTLSQKMVYYFGGIILSEHWAVCKAVLGFQAGALTSKLSSMTKLVKGAACLELESLFKYFAQLLVILLA
jgi:hypothetical protein